MSMDQVKQIFIAEAKEQLDVMEQCLLEIEAGEAEVYEHVDAIFRAAHTIKGSAGIFGYDDVVAFAHKVENVLDAARSGTLELTLELVATLLDSHHYLHSLIIALTNTDVASQTDQGKSIELNLCSYLSSAESVVGQEDEIVIDTCTQEIESWLIRITYSQEVYRDGMDPVSQINFLKTLGEVQRVEVFTVFPESMEEYQPELCYLRLAIEFTSSVGQAEIEDVFEFIADSSDISVVKKESGKELLSAFDVHPSVNDDESILPSTSFVPVIDTEQQKTLDNQFLKINAKNLDALINLVGELTTSSAANELLAHTMNNGPLIESVNQTAQLVEKIRDQALSLRLVKMSDTFNRLKRIVRDIAKDQNKDVQLNITGADAELDKTIVDRLIDPLMHLVRNAIDHGIEEQETRLKNGKSVKGNIGIKAYHDAGTFIIEIEDDGKGIDQEKILETAINKGLITESQSLATGEINQLIFEPGLSTAEVITTISGRGVGMDVVKKDIEKLRGQIKVNSERGKGTHFKIRLPLTLAIIDGFEVIVGDTHLVIPSNLIRSCIPFDPAWINVEHDILNLRGEVVPFVRMSEVLNIQDNNDVRKHIVIVQFGSQKAGLLVEEILGDIQAVVKPLNAIFRSLRGIGGSTVLRTGDIGFIVDIPQLIQFAADKESANLKTKEVSYKVKVEHV